MMAGHLNELAVDALSHPLGNIPVHVEPDKPFSYELLWGPDTWVREIGEYTEYMMSQSKRDY